MGLNIRRIKGKKKKVMISVHCSTYEKILDIAALQDKSFSYIIHELLREYVKKHYKPLERLRKKRGIFLGEEHQY